MRLKKVSIKNFRCFEDLQIDLHPRLTVLVGENGSGKTAILDALAIGLSPVLRHLSSANQRLKGGSFKDTDFRLVSVESRGRDRWVVSDYAQVEIETTDGIRWDAWKPSSSRVEPSSRIGETALISYLVPIAESINSPSPMLLPVMAYYGARRGYIEVPERLRASKNNYTHPAAALADCLDPLSDFKEMLKWFDLEEASELRANKGVSDDDFDSSKALSTVRAAVRALLNGAYSNPYFNQDHKFVVEPLNGGSPLQVTQLSQGYQSMLALGMDFAQRLAVANPHIEYETEGGWNGVLEAWEALGVAIPEDEMLHYIPDAPALMAPAIMLVDEIDLHLHPKWQQKVLSDLIRAFPATQFIVTTHSPQVLSTVKRENIRIIGPDPQGAIIAAPPLGASYGEPSGNVLHSVMMVDPIPPISEKPDLQRLTEWVEQGLYRSPEAQQLMQHLTATLGEQHPQLQRLQRSIRRQEILSGAQHSESSGG